MPNVFVSHARGHSLVALLEETFAMCLTDVQTWTDTRITGGKWNRQILQALDQADAIVLLATPTVLGSIYRP